MDRFAQPGSTFWQASVERGDEFGEVGDVIAIDDPGAVESALANPLEDGDADGFAAGENLFPDLGDVSPGYRHWRAATIAATDALVVQPNRERRGRDDPQIADKTADEDDANQRAHQHRSALAVCDEEEERAGEEHADARQPALAHTHAGADPLAHALILALILTLALALRTLRGCNR